MPQAESMEHDDETPISREPWRRRLQEGVGLPPQTTDARIRKAARRAIRARFSRWLLPASLAASVLLAVVIVERQYGERDPADVLTEADVPASAPAERQIDEMRHRDKPRAEPYSAPVAPPPVGHERAAPPPVGGPERELKESSEVPGEAAGHDLPSSRATGARQEAREREADAQFAAPPTASSRPTGMTAPSPEDWYAEIEKLRAAGRIEEADRELERLKAAYPGWLERHLEETENR
jgi:hypothetical protein